MKTAAGEVNRQSPNRSTTVGEAGIRAIENVVSVILSQPQMIC